MFQFSNYNEHPTRNNYTVFNFKTREEGDYFEALLKKDKIWYERDNSGTIDNPQLSLFGVKKADHKKALHHNFMTSAKFRKPFMRERAFRYIVVAISVTLVGLGIAGYIITKGESTATEIHSGE